MEMEPQRQSASPFTKCRGRSDPVLRCFYTYLVLYLRFMLLWNGEEAELPPAHGLERRVLAASGEEPPLPGRGPSDVALPTSLSPSVSESGKL